MASLVQLSAECEDELEGSRRGPLCCPLVGQRKTRLLGLRNLLGGCPSRPPSRSSVGKEERPWLGQVDVRFRCRRRSPRDSSVGTRARLSVGTHHFFSLAAGGDHLAVLEWARRNGCPFGESAGLFPAGTALFRVREWAISHHFPWDPATCAAAAVSGHLADLQWACGRGPLPRRFL